MKSMFTIRDKGPRSNPIRTPSFIRTHPATDHGEDSSFIDLATPKTTIDNIEALSQWNKPNNVKYRR
jgi:hypothetical protein